MGAPSPLVGSIPVGPLVDALGSVQNALNALVGAGAVEPGGPGWLRRAAEPFVVGPEDYGVVSATDLYGPKAVSGLATLASGGTEVKFNKEGIIVVGPGAAGVYWADALDAAQGSGYRWKPLLASRKIRYHRERGFFLGTATTGGITATGVVSLEFYAKPREIDWNDWHALVERWTSGTPSDGGAGITAGIFPGGTGAGTDVTLGTFSDAGAGTQIFLAGTNMPSTGASKQVNVVVSTPGNTDFVWLGETSALAVASNNGIGASGQDVWNVPSGGKLFFKANSGTQKVSARVRS